MLFKLLPIGDSGVGCSQFKIMSCMPYCYFINFAYYICLGVWGRHNHLNNFVKQKEQVVEEEKTNTQQMNIGYLSSK